MELQHNFRCKTCESPLDGFIENAVGGVVECPYCYNKWTIPKRETSPAALTSIRIGEHNLDTGKFDDAYTAYKKAAEIDSTEPEAYFGMALAEFKVQYLKDVSGDKPRLQPVCHEISDKQFSDDGNYMRAYMKATDSQRKEYERKAQEIDYILKEFYKLKQSGLDYDCFICVKVSDGNGGKTEDSKDADYIYRLLKDKGYKPFYSEYEIRNKQGADYEAHILYALYTSECMLVVCRDKAYLQTPWVKNEYTRFLKLVNDEEKESDSITFVFYENAIEKLPGRAGKLQGIDFSRRSADGQIVDFVENHTPEARQRRKDAATAKLREQEAQANRLKELEEKLARMQSNSYGADFSYDELLERMERKAEEKKQKQQLIQILRRQLKEIIIKKNREKAKEERRAKAQEEAERVAREKAEAARIFAEKAKDIAPTIDYYNSDEFIIIAEQKKLKKYVGNKSDVIIPQGIVSIGEGAFERCVGIKSVKIPNGVTSIGDSAFSGCSGLTKINIPEGVTSIESFAFSGSSGLTRITFSNSVTSIGDSAFSGCSGLIGINLPVGLKSIGSNAFSDCKNLEKVIVPQSVTSIGSGAFSYCNKVTVCCRHNQIPDGFDKDWDILEKKLLLKKRIRVCWRYTGKIYWE